MAGSQAVFKFIAEEIPKSCDVNIIFQYRTIFRACKYGDINRGPFSGEYRKAIEMAVDFKLHRGFEVN
jgi:uncharacterized Fe-S radical SAM superfamily protein PflX